MSCLKRLNIGSVSTSFLKWGLVLLVGELFILPPLDTDLGWQLRYGAHLFFSHRPWYQNHLTFFLPNYHWNHSYTLYQLLVFIVYRWMGFPGLALLSGIVVGLTYYLLIKRFSLSLSLFSLLIFYASGWGVSLLGIRSQLFTLLGLAGLSSFFPFSIPFKKKDVWLVFFLFSLWANLHGGFILGLFYLLTKVVFDGLDKGRKELFKGILVLLAAVAGSLLNPFSFKIYFEIYRHTYYPLNRLIAEWVPPGPFGVFFIVVALVSVFLIFTFLFQEEKGFLTWPVGGYLFLFLVFSYLGLKARRHLPLVGIGYLFLLNQVVPKISLNEPRLKQIKLKFNFLFFLGLIVLIVNFLPSKVRMLSSLSANWSSPLIGSRYPRLATEWLKQHPHTCHYLFNAYEWGGYLEWQLPFLKVFVDGRMPAWKTISQKSPYTFYLEVIQAKDGYLSRLDTYGADCLLIGKGTFLDLALNTNSQRKWQRLVEGPRGVLYVKLR